MITNKQASFNRSLLTSNIKINISRASGFFFATGGMEGVVPSNANGMCGLHMIGCFQQCFYMKKREQVCKQVSPKTKTTYKYNHSYNTHPTVLLLSSLHIFASLLFQHTSYINQKDYKFTYAIYIICIYLFASPNLPTVFLCCRPRTLGPNGSAPGETFVVVRVGTAMALDKAWGNCGSRSIRMGTAI